MISLIVVWQNPKSRFWIPVGRLDKSAGNYRFVYADDVLDHPDFVPFSRMHTGTAHESNKLFPVFANRLMPKSRSDYPDYLRWLDLDSQEFLEPLSLLARSEGTKETSNIQLYSYPEKTTDGDYAMRFFCHGLRYSSAEANGLLNEIEVGRRLFPMDDFQNPADPAAMALRCESPNDMLGFAPTFLAKDFRTVLSTNEGREKGRITVEKINRDAPTQLRLLCKIVAPWPDDFVPFSGVKFSAVDLRY